MELYWKQGDTWVPVGQSITVGSVVHTRRRIETDADLRTSLGIKEIVYLPDDPPEGQERIEWERADTADEPRWSPVYYYVNLTGAQWRTLVKGLGDTPRAALRNAVAAADSDASTDVVYWAAQYLKGEPVMIYDRVIAALATIGITLSAGQLSAFNARWAAASAIS